MWKNSMRAATFNRFHHLPFKCKKIAWSVICIKRPPDRRPPRAPTNRQVTILSFSPSGVCSWMSSQKHSGEKWVRHACNPLFSPTSEICFLPRCTNVVSTFWLFHLNLIYLVSGQLDFQHNMSSWIKYANPKVQMKVCDPKKYESMKVCDLKKYESMQPKKSMKVCDPKKYESMRPKKVWKYGTPKSMKVCDPKKYESMKVCDLKKYESMWPQKVWKYATSKVCDPKKYATPKSMKVCAAWNHIWNPNAPGQWSGGRILMSVVSILWFNVFLLSSSSSSSASSSQSLLHNNDDDDHAGQWWPYLNVCRPCSVI